VRSFPWLGREFQIGEPRVIDRVEAGGRLPLLVRVLSARTGLRQFVLVRRVST
jgi:hypothetical protein